jgi:hypothetical protein
MKYTGEIEGQYGSREDKKKLALIREIPGNTGELVTLVCNFLPWPPLPPAGVMRGVQGGLQLQLLGLFSLFL